MRKATLLQMMMTCLFLLTAIAVNAQYQFPPCSPAYDPTQPNYAQGSEVSLDGINYRAKYWTSATPPDQSWETIGPCGNGGLGPDYPGPQRIIGYLPYWLSGYDIATEFDPSSVTHINLAFVLFQQNNNDFNSANFASIAFEPYHQHRVDSLIVDCDVLNRAHQAGVTVSVAVGGATDFAFLWLMNKYYNNDAKMDEIATVIANYVTSRGLDGVDLDLECWWPDPNIAGTTEIGGRVRGDKWGGVDQGPHPAGIGLTKLSQKLRQKLPNKLISTAVFATSWYGNNYDDAMAQYMDWIGLMSYDFTGSWDNSAYGPHSAMYKVPLGTYPRQTADNPIYSVTDALEYWMGIAPPAWNHDGGFNVPKAKLCAGVPTYGYDFSQQKPAGGNGYLAVPYKDIIRDFPNAATSYDPLDPHNMGGHIGLNGRNIYYNTPKGAAEKIVYSNNYGHQGVIVWEVSQDVLFTSPHSILKAIKDANIPGPKPPVVAITAPTDGTSHTINTSLVVSANANDPDGHVVKVEFFEGQTLIGTDSVAPYSISYTPTVLGSKVLTAKATDNSSSSTVSAAVNITIIDGPVPPTVSITSPTDGSTHLINTLLSITADASDQDGQVVKVEFFEGQTLLGTDSIAPYSISYTPTVLGPKVLTAKATDNSSSSTISAAVNITVIDGGPFPPTVSITSPTEGATFTSGSTVTIEATANDTDGTITKVDFYNGTNLLGTANAFPYQYSWNPVDNPYALKAIATDNDNLTGESTVVNITVGGPGCTAPAWQPGVIYDKELVSHNGHEWYAKWWTTNEEPGTTGQWGVWEDRGACGVAPAALATDDLSMYPNPFEGQVTFAFTLTEASQVVLKVTNSMGTPVATVVNKQLNAGYHEFTYNGNHLKSGVYLCNLTIGKETTTKTLVKK